MAVTKFGARKLVLRKSDLEPICPIYVISPNTRNSKIKKLLSRETVSQPMSKIKSRRLMALSAAAAALPGISTTAQAAAPTEHTMGYRYTKYTESDLKASDLAVDAEGNPRGSKKRYDIDVHQFGYSGPLTSEWALSLSLQNEVLSGASPWNTVRDENGDVKVVMTGASPADKLQGIEEERTDGSAGLTYYYKGGSVSGNVAFSTEDDYDSTSFGFSWEGEFDKKQTVIAAGFSLSDDELAPEANVDKRNQRHIIPPGTKAKKDSTSFFVSASRITGMNTVILGGFSWTKKEGYLHDAYKANDQRPDEKEMWTINGSLRHYMKKQKMAAHLDFRFYDDDWGVTSYTYTGSLHKKYGKLMVIPSLRYYLQSKADFYAPVIVNTEFNYFADDARLSDYGAYSLGLKFKLDVKPITYTASMEFYDASQDLSPSKSDFDEHPALISFTRFTLGADYKF